MRDEDSGHLGKIGLVFDGCRRQIRSEIDKRLFVQQ